MSNADNKNTDSSLDANTLALLGSAPGEVNPSVSDMLALKSKVMQRIDDNTDAFRTIRADEGDWVEISPKLYKKILSEDLQSNLQSYLLKAEAGAIAPGHKHEADELCLVLEGDFHINGLHLKAGDYHFAPKGSSHGDAWTDKGTLLYLQGSLHA